MARFSSLNCGSPEVAVHKIRVFDTYLVLIRDVLIREVQEMSLNKQYKDTSLAIISWATCAPFHVYVYGLYHINKLLGGT